MLIRPATLADVDALSALHVAGWKDGYAGLMPASYLESLGLGDKKPLWLYILGEATPEALVLIADDFHGFIWGGPAHEPTLDCDAEIYALYVRAARWRQGVGRRLVAAAARVLSERGCRRLVVWTLTDNPRSNHFYRALGGTATERRFDVYGGQKMELLAYVWPDMSVLTRILD